MMIKEVPKVALEIGEMTSQVQLVPVFVATNADPPTGLIDDSQIISSNQDYEISLQGIILPLANTNIPYETIYTSWQEAFANYLAMSEDEFAELLPKELEAGKTEDYFLNLTLQQIVEEPIDPVLEKALEIKLVSSEGGVDSLARVVDLEAFNYDRRESEDDKRVVSVAQLLQFQPEVLPPLSTLQTLILSPQNVSPNTPDISLGNPANTIPNIFESYLNNYEHVEIRGNIFNGPFGYNINADPGAGASLISINASFSSSNIEGGTISFPVTGEIVLTSAQGNTFTFFTAAVEGHDVGDFFFTLNNGIQTPPYASASFDSFVGFIDQFLYGITNNFFNTSIGSIFFKIVDDVPVTHDRVALSLNESQINAVGSELLSSVEISVGTLLTDLNPTGTLIIAPNVPFSPVSPGANDNYFGGDGGSVSSIVLDSVIGATDVTASPFVTSFITPVELAYFTNFGLVGSQAGDPALMVNLSNGNSLIVDALTGQYVLVLNSAIHHSLPDTIATLNFKFTFTDADGDSSTSTLSFNMQDDAPVAADVSQSIDETTLFVKLLTNPLATEIKTGNLLTDGATDSVFGADGGMIYSVTVGNIVDNTLQTITDNGVDDLDLTIGMIQVETKYGSILLDTQGANVGAYTYTLDETKTVTANDALGTVDDVIGFQLIDSDNSVDSGNLTVTVNLNQGPTAVDDSGANYTTNEDAILTVIAPGVLSNDTDPDAGDVKRVISIDTTGTLGAVSFNSDGSLSYNPNGQFESLAFGNSATTTFTYTMADAEGKQSAATVTVTVEGVNDAPSGTDHTVTTLLEDSTYVFSASDFGFSDPIDSPGNTLLAVKITSLPSVGSFTDNGVLVTLNQFISISDINSGLLQFTPAANANGANYANFTFQVQDNGGTTNGGVDLDQSANTMTINVTSVNDAPMGTSNTVSTLEDTQKVFTAADFGFTDPNDPASPNSLQSIIITALPGLGVLSLAAGASVPGVVSNGQEISLADIAFLTYTPAADGNGLSYATFDFKVKDSGGLANGGIDTDPTANTITIDVTADNDAPVIADAGSTVNYSISGGTPVIIDGSLTLSDVDDTNLNGAVVTISSGALAGDTLAATLIGGITSSYNPTTFELTLSGNSSLANYESVLESVTFSASSATVQTRTITWQVDDGNASNNLSNQPTSLVDIIAPVFLDLNNDGIHLVSSTQSPVSMDISGKGDVHQIGWTTPEDGVLVYDYDGGQQITLNEISFTSYAKDAKTDLEGLRLAFDSNKDNILDSQDSLFGKFGVWQDTNNNGLVDSGEHQTLDQRGIVSISLISDNQQQMQNGNLIHGFSDYKTVDGHSYAIADTSLVIGQRVETQTLHLNDILPSQEQIDFSKLPEAPSVPASAIETAPLVATPSTSSETDSSVVPPVVTEHLLPALQTQEVAPA
ncbi:MAG: cadherin-like domain-containing protein [Gammaproteobacteria bacterium]|jgi:VCBS repeat-containing protein|nr:cadherin-like domain-containing protein [Gammaproteobacteria bacterium]